MNKKLLERIKFLFTEKLQSKTGWGRTEIISAYEECVNIAIMEMLEI